MEPNHLHQGAYFITAIAHERRRVFQTDRNAQLFVDTLTTYRDRNIYYLHAYVVMPDHVHLLLTPQNKALESVIGMIKGGFSHRLKSSMPVWQTGYRDRRCRGREEFIRYREYIHFNPVRAGLCTEAQMFLYSSAYQYGETSGAKAPIQTSA